jgi:hypothetical protein
VGFCDTLQLTDRNNMSWPGADEPPAESGQGYQFDRPTDIASLGTFRGGHLVALTPEQTERALKLTSGSFESLPQLPFFGPVFGFTTQWQKTEVARVLVGASASLGRLLTPAEADVFAYQRSKFCSRVTWTPPAVLVTAAYYTRRGLSTFRFPLYTPKAAWFQPTSFPTASKPFLTGQSAVRLWHVLRFGAYTLAARLCLKGFIVGFSQAGYVMSLFQDDRLEAMRGELKAMSSRSASDASSSHARRPTDLPTPQARRQPMPTQQAPEPQTTPRQDDDDSYLFDDGSPVAPSQRQPPAASAPQSAQQGSAWDRIRQRAKSEEGAQWNPGQQQNGASGGQQRTDQYTFSPAEQEKAYAKDQAQKEFDAMLERERRGVGGSGGSGGPGGRN